MEADSERQECSVADEAQDPEIAPDIQGSAETQKRREQMKLAANLFNNLAVVSLASGFFAPLLSVRPSGTPISISEGGYANFDGLSINALGSIFLGLVFCGVCEVVAQSFLLKLKE